MAERVVLDLTGLKCQGCATAVEKAVLRMAGVTSASVDLGRAMGTFEYDPARVSVQDLMGAIIQAGYTARVPLTK